MRAREEATATASGSRLGRDRRHRQCHNKPVIVVSLRIVSRFALPSKMARYRACADFIKSYMINANFEKLWSFCRLMTRMRGLVLGHPSKNDRPVHNNALEVVDGGIGQQDSNRSVRRVASVHRLGHWPSLLHSPLTSPTASSPLRFSVINWWYLSRWSSRRHCPCGAAWARPSQYLQGVQRLLLQLWLGIFSVNTDGIQYPFNHLIYTWGDFIWHMKHHGTFNGSQDTDGHSFWQDFCKFEFCLQ